MDSGIPIGPKQFARSVGATCGGLLEVYGRPPRGQCICVPTCCPGCVLNSHIPGSPQLGTSHVQSNERHSKLDINSELGVMTSTTLISCVVDVAYHGMLAQRIDAVLDGLDICPRTCPSLDAKSCTYAT